MDAEKVRLSTKCLHAGHEPDAETLSRGVPIYQTTSFVFRDAEHAANLFALKEFGNIYTRLGNPTTEVLEKRLAAVHDATGALAVASGMAAIFYTVTGITAAGQNIVSGKNLYGGTVTLFAHTLKRFGIECRFVDTRNLSEVEKAIDENTRLLYTESIGNPRCNVDDMDGLAAIAQRNGIPFVVDNTASPPPIFNPFEHGADITVYSLTKMIGGHGTSIGGAVIEKGDFDWSRNGKFPEIDGPDESYHGLNFWETFSGLGMAFVLKLRTGLLRDTGACLSPFNAHQFLLGLETLPMRAERHCANARKVAEFLENHPRVSWVNYAGLPSHPDHERAASLMPLGPSALFGFGIKGGLEAGKTFIDSVQLCSHLANILDAKTLVIHPASTTHQQLSPEEQANAGVSEDFVRISVGLEDPEDIIADLDQALNAAANNAGG
jgi:O-acetylhomoserine (thiol)-lyase